MSEHLYYCPELRTGRLELPAEEAHHAATVLRARIGDRVGLMNGRGLAARGVVRSIAKRSVVVEVLETGAEAPPRTPPLVIHTAVPKAARQQVLVEKCTELGVTAIQPVITRRGVAVPTRGGVEKWRRYAIEAAKQSRQLWLPELLPAVGFADSLRAASGAGLHLLASTRPDARPLASALTSELTERDPASPIHIWIGPEGGFTDDEVDAALAEGLSPVSLGPSVLRIETAAIAATAWVRLAGPEPKRSPAIIA